MGTTRLIRRAAAFAGACLALASCTEPQTGPLRIIAVGDEPNLLNPNRAAVGAGDALLLDTVAQGLVRFDGAGEIEPALAQSWIVSDDGRRYTFRIRRTLWARGEPVTARQVVERLQAATGRNSRNALKPVLGAIERIEAMTERVLEIRLVAPRPHFVQLLAQPEMAILADDQGTGPYRMGGEVDGFIRLIPPQPDEDSDLPEPQAPEILLRGATAAAAIAAFVQGRADLVTGGTIAAIPLLRAADLPRDRLIHDPTQGLFGLIVARAEGPLADPRFRHALAMAVDRDAIQARFSLPTLQPRMSLLPAGLDEVPSPALPDWATVPLATRRAAAARIVAQNADGERPRVRVAMPDGLGYRILFAHLKRDWRLIGVDAERVGASEAADLRLTDAVAPAELAPWYLRHFTCDTSAVCDPAADQMLEAARAALNPVERQALLVQADRALTAAAPFIPIGQPVRWSLRHPRLALFRPNQFARHPPTELVEQRD